jgi:hypothetical protein
MGCPAESKPEQLTTHGGLHPVLHFERRYAFEFRYVVRHQYIALQTLSNWSFPMGFVHNSSISFTDSSIFCPDAVFDLLDFLDH